MSPARPSLTRALTAALALYALLLQPFLLAATPSVAGEGQICHTSGDPAPAGPGDRHPCCAAACVVSLAAGPALLPGLVVWPSRDARVLARRAAELVLATGPPVHAASARGPPVV